MALPFETTITASGRDDGMIRVVSPGFGDETFAVDADPHALPTWVRYIAGTVQILGSHVPCTGFDATLHTTIPVGASLSSSAALEVATGFLVSALAGVEPDAPGIAAVGQRVENEIVGVKGGIMDQLISATAVEGAASLIDCRSLAVEPVLLPEGTRVVIMDTMTRRELVDSEYNLRREACMRAAADIGVPALRDANLNQLDQVVAEVDRRRARHVIAENLRVLEAVDAMRANDAAQLGVLMNASHESLSTDYEVSSRALDEMSAIARAHSACFGARMTGGGFAGSAVALVDNGSVDGFVDHVRSAYSDSAGRDPDLWVVTPSAGASVAELDS
jgi:galactokinase